MARQSQNAGILQALKEGAHRGRQVWHERTIARNRRGSPLSFTRQTPILLNERRPRKTHAPAGDFEQKENEQMEINGKVHCFFEQSGTFKNEFIKLGIPAEDYDIQNNFGETDHVVDLFENIQNAYEGGVSVFDNITKDDLILAFFPCIKFCSVMEQMQHSDFYDASQKKQKDYKTESYFKRKWATLRKLSQERFFFYDIALKLIADAEIRGLRLIIENPWHPTNFTNHFFPLRVTLIDNDRTIRGDYYKKPTGYWFLNCEPTHGETVQPCPLELRRKLTAGSGGSKKKKELISAGCSEYEVAMYIEHETKTGLCDTKRSEIRTDYARNWICDFILGKKQDIGQLSLF